MQVGDQDTLTILIDPDLGNTFSLHSGSLGSFSLGNLQRISDTIYTAEFTVSEGGTDYPAEQNIPVSSLQLYNGLIPGNVFSTGIIQGNDHLDANSPVINNIAPITSGPKKIGDEIPLLLAADQSGYEFEDISVINGIPFSDPAILVSDFGAFNFIFNYKI